MRVHRTEIFKVATNEMVTIPNKCSIDEILRFSFLDIINTVVESGVSFIFQSYISRHLWLR